MEVNNFVIPSYPVKFIGACGNCESRPRPRYKWTVYDDFDDELVLNETSTSTGNSFVPLFNEINVFFISNLTNLYVSVSRV